MTDPRVLVQNAADATQVKDARRKERDTRLDELDDVRTVLAQPQGRRFLWRLLGECRVFASVMDGTQERTFYNAGKQDVGHFLLDEIIEADPLAYVKMQRESMERTNA